MLIRIEDVSSEEEMRQARQTRMTEGKHTIPVPSMEIKHEFSGNFLNPIPACAAALTATVVCSRYKMTPNAPSCARPFPHWAAIPSPMKHCAA